MSDLISRQMAIEVLRNRWLKTRNYEGIGEDIAEECEIYLKTLPSAQPTVDAVPVIRCKDCKHQRKEYREDKRRKDGGYNIYWCDLVDGYAPLGFDDEYCAWAERKEE